MIRAAIFVSVLAIGTAYAGADDPVRLDSGMVSGAATSTPDMRVYKGIPYAAPPTGGAA